MIFYLSLELPLQRTGRGSLAESCQTHFRKLFQGLRERQGREGKAIRALRQGRSLLTSAAGPVLTFSASSHALLFNK